MFMSELTVALELPLPLNKCLTSSSRAAINNLLSIQLIKFAHVLHYSMYIFSFFSTLLASPEHDTCGLPSFSLSLVLLDTFTTYLMDVYQNMKLQQSFRMCPNSNDEQPFNLHVCLGHKKASPHDISDRANWHSFLCRNCNEEQLINLHVLLGHKITRGSNRTKESLNITDIGKCSKSPTELAKNILVEGCAGVGKTTLACRLCHEWAKGELLQQWSIVIHVDL